jgi:hypothetical protein
LNNFEVIFDIDAKKKLIAELSLQMSGANFWSDPEHSTKVVKQLKSLKGVVEPWELAFARYHELS